ncbi:hypothetical protein BOW53_02805 [Solemya pervernicosa gill symbiont]|uniref:DUF2059 domain-containing protein n=2 Tax=Gammaproteobacteria incertae sedis TaxID=118884 RepID=A0A1T2L9M0_9GAMM|nr:DUF2059 domain-containing protein [Candidatus Reidiella endopervernicosa]OOZ41626.1 hypothetical protein BOW53_02805 [Solemya pervernicosa gill symbiont]QKQ26876.1 DUF2059 domain-containing protein [Candidatus Reidiella endopervernicosa]
MKIKVLSLLVLLFSGWQAPLSAAGERVSVERAEEIRKLLVLTGSDKIGMQVFSSMMESNRRNLPQVPDEFWNEVIKEFKPDELIELVVPIYAKHLTHEEVKALVRFYQSPLGRKLIAAMPGITRDSLNLGQMWGRSVGERVKRRLMEKGYIQS